jgi:hypothetical protein
MLKRQTIAGCYVASEILKQMLPDNPAFYLRLLRNRNSFSSLFRLS